MRVGSGGLHFSLSLSLSLSFDGSKILEKFVFVFSFYSDPFFSRDLTESISFFCQVLWFSHSSPGMVRTGSFLSFQFLRSDCAYAALTFIVPIPTRIPKLSHYSPFSLALSSTSSIFYIMYPLHHAHFTYTPASCLHCPRKQLHYQLKDKQIKFHASLIICLLSACSLLEKKKVGYTQ